MGLSDKALDEASALVRGAARLVTTRRASRLRFGSRVCIRVDDGSLLRTDDAGSLIGGTRQFTEESSFVLVAPGEDFRTILGRRLRFGDYVGFRDERRQLFLGVDFDNDAVWTCHGPQLREWETLRIERGNGPPASRRERSHFVNFGDYVTLSVHARWRGDSWRYLQYRRDTSRVHGYAPSVGTWETFVLRPVPD